MVVESKLSRSRGIASADFKQQLETNRDAIDEEIERYTKLRANLLDQNKELDRNAEIRRERIKNLRSILDFNPPVFEAVGAMLQGGAPPTKGGQRDADGEEVG